MKPSTTPLQTLADAATATTRLRLPLRSLFLTLLLASTTAASQNLAVNGGFATGLEDWELLAAGEAEWNGVDIDGDPASGSALIRSNEALPVSRVYPLRKCIVLTEAGDYRVGASGRIPAAGGRLVASITLFVAATCTGGGTVGAGVFLDRPGQWEGWDFKLRAENMPRALIVQLGIEKDAAGGTYSGVIDDVYVLLQDRFFSSSFENAFE